MKKIIVILMLLCMTMLCNASGGPYPMSANVVPDSDETKVVVFSNPYFSGGNLVLVNIETNESIYILSSVTYYNTWYYIIPKGTYRIAAIEDGYTVQTQGAMRNVGDTVSYNYSGYITFYPEE